jgi:transcriptional regulator with XRE-family HTH domain
MATTSSPTRVGPLLREWRKRRRRSQFELALDAGVSARHLSFVETGRSTPSPEMVLLLAEQLEVPFRERNQLLLAAGHAPAFPERSLDDPELAPVRAALDRILAAHEPNPAVVFDRAWNLVAANSVMGAMVEIVGIDPELLEPPVNILRAGLHPRGMAPQLLNLDEWRAHFLERLSHQVAVTGDDELAALLEEIAGYPGSGEGDPSPARRVGEALGPLKVRAPDGRDLSFFGMFATFDTPFEVTTSELAMELMFPADRRTAEALEELASTIANHEPQEARDGNE